MALGNSYYTKMYVFIILFISVYLFIFTELCPEEANEAKEEQN